MHFIANDQDGPQKNEIVWILEKIRRSISTLKAYGKSSRSKKNILKLVDDMIGYLS
jgi:hypothetical protein